MFKSNFTLAICAAFAVAIPAFAVDGVTLIDQSAVTFPYQITQPGSYRLSSNLTTAGTGAIVILAADVTLDLNGFTVSCGGCSGVPGIQGTGVRTVIENGNVVGFGGPNGTGAPYGIYFQSGDSRGPHTARIEHVNADGNTVGIFASGNVSLSVSNSSASSNSYMGINAGPTGSLTVTNSRVSNNTQFGIAMANGVVTGSAIVGNGVGGTFLRGGIGVGGNTSAATITNNTIAGNQVFGIFALSGSPTVGFGSNTFGGNVVDVSGAFPNGSMHNNVCSFGSC